jgi:hypothetical protein
MSRLRIWKERVSGLSLPGLKKLSGKFEFTGGQIDNVVRKLVMHNVLHGQTTLEELERFCEEEVNEKPGFTKIGFQRRS